MKNLILYLIIATLFISCNTEEPTYYSSSMLIKDPVVLIYEGSSMGTRGSQEAPFWNGTENVKPSDITQEELEAVVEYFKTHPGKSDAVEIDFKNYYVQQVYYSDEDYIAADGQSYDAFGCVNQIQTGPQWNGDNIFSGNDPFNKCRYIYDSSSLDFWYNNSKCSYWSNNFKMVYIPDYGYYVGFDVEGQPDGVYDANKNMHITNSPDGWYYDRIIKIVPADENGNILPLPTTPDDPAIDDPSEIDPTKGEVEVNLHADKKPGDYLESHLSVHVRAATDIEIFIPVPHRYICEADDMAIVMKHEHNHMGHGGPKKYTYTLKDSNLAVTLYLDWTDDPEGIKIWTDGITQEVIDWCQEKVGDGITFEIWNYFNDKIDFDTLKQYLDQSIIKYNPDYEYKNPKPNLEKDCTVKKS